MARPCCPARKDFPDVHTTFLGLNEDFLRHFAYLSRVIMGARITAADAEAIAQIGYRHDPHNNKGLGFITGFLADYIEKQMPTTADQYDAIDDVSRRTTEKLREELGREPTSSEVNQAMVGQPIPTVTAETIEQWMEWYREDSEASAATE